MFYSFYSHKEHCTNIRKPKMTRSAQPHYRRINSEACLSCGLIAKEWTDVTCSVCPHQKQTQNLWDLHKFLTQTVAILLLSQGAKISVVLPQGNFLTVLYRGEPDLCSVHCKREIPELLFSSRIFGLIPVFKYHYAPLYWRQMSCDAG